MRWRLVNSALVGDLEEFLDEHSLCLDYYILCRQDEVQIDLEVDMLGDFPHRLQISCSCFLNVFCNAKGYRLVFKPNILKCIVHT